MSKQIIIDDLMNTGGINNSNIKEVTMIEV
ncbi:hypothetical protein LCGC14_2803780, partial [marine sediment metagenome]